MIRAFRLPLVLSCLAAICSYAQAQPAPAVTRPTAKTVAKKPAPTAQATAKSVSPDSGPCQIGVISAIGDAFGVKTIGLTVFGNEFSEAPIGNWGLDDVVVARVRSAAGPGVAVRRIAYAEGTFTPYYHPAPNLFRRADDELVAIVRKVAGNASCERYVVATKLNVEFGGTNQTVSGVSIVRQGLGDLIKHTYLVTYVQVRMLDGQSFAIHKAPISFDAVLKSAFTGRRGPVREMDNSMFPTSASEAAGSAKLRDEARALLTETLDRTLPEQLALNASAAKD